MVLSALNDEKVNKNIIFFIIIMRTKEWINWIFVRRNGVTVSMSVCNSRSGVWIFTRTTLVASLLYHRHRTSLFRLTVSKWLIQCHYKAVWVWTWEQVLFSFTVWRHIKLLKILIIVYISCGVTLTSHSKWSGLGCEGDTQCYQHCRSISTL